MVLVCQAAICVDFSYILSPKFTWFMASAVTLLPDIIMIYSVNQTCIGIKQSQVPKIKTLKNDVKCIHNDVSSSILLSFVKALWQSIHISRKIPELNNKIYLQPKTLGLVKSEPKIYILTFSNSSVWYLVYVCLVLFGPAAAAISAETIKYFQASCPQQHFFVVRKANHRASLLLAYCAINREVMFTGGREGAPEPYAQCLQNEGRGN